MCIVFKYIIAYTYMYIYMYMYTHPYTYIHLRIEAEGALEGRSSQTCTLAQPRAKAAVYVYMYTYKFIYIYIYIYTYIYTCEQQQKELYKGAHPRCILWCSFALKLRCICISINIYTLIHLRTAANRARAHPVFFGLALCCSSNIYICIYL